MNRVASRKSQQGVLSVEVALLFPIVLVFFILVTEVSLFFFYGHRLQAASYNGARYAAEHWQSTNIEQRAREVAVFGVAASAGKPVLPGLSTNDVTVSKEIDGEHISVFITYEYAPVISLSILDLSKTLVAESKMRIL